MSYTEISNTLSVLEKVIAQNKITPDLSGALDKLSSHEFLMDGVGRFQKAINDENLLAAKEAVSDMIKVNAFNAMKESGQGAI